ncbi:hypothetical protein C4564_05080 [Candidatus Microgenomates bacterium]|nr:MAG: hypothetical protein C4564_05080 [Candidatus Microgenomates bacterium]
MLSGNKRLIIFFFFIIIIYALTSAGKTPYDYFTRLADAFVHGRLYLTEQPSWLSELIPTGDEKFYVVQPPMPAILLVPFVFIFGSNFPQQIIAHIIGAAIAIVCVRLSLKFTKNKAVTLWMGVFGAFGTIMWYEASNGSVWLLGQLTAALFLLLAINESLGRKRLFLVGLFIGAAYLARVHTIVSGLFFVYLLRDQLLIKPKNIIKFALGLSVFIGFNAIYNFVRFGVPWDKGYFLIPGIYDEPWFDRGMLNIAYIPRHLDALFLRLPNVSKEFPYITPSWYGLSIALTSPAFIVALKNNIRDHEVRLAWLTVLLIFMILALRGGTGWTQFGYRYAVDFYPFLLYLLARRLSKTGVTKTHWVLLLVGVIVNLWGVIWINKMGWVSF